jgi:hypothetical protein
MSSSSSTPRRSKRIILVLDGNNSRFPIRLNDRIATSGRIGITQYILTGATVPIITIYFMDGAQFRLIDTASNVIQPGGFSLYSAGATANIAYSTPRLIADVASPGIQEFNLDVRDGSGAAHNPATNKLFDVCVIELALMEIQGDRTPNWLQTVPGIQETFDS